MAHQVEGFRRWEIRRDPLQLPGRDPEWMVGAYPADDEWERRSNTNEPHLEFLGEPGSAVAVELIVRAASMPGWATRLRLEVIDGEIEMTQLEQRRLPASPAILLGSDEGEPVVIAEIADAVQRKPLSSQLLRKVGFGDAADEAKQLLTDDVVLKRFLGDGWSRPPVRAGRSQRSPHFHARWANRYVWALGHDQRRPVTFIVKADRDAGVMRTEAEVRGQVNRARPRFLTRSELPGKAGGQLTDESKVLLRQLGIEEGANHVVAD